MAISEEYLISYVLQETQRGRLPWRRCTEEDFSGFQVRHNGVLLRLARIESTTESRLWIQLESDEGSALISEPRSFGLWGKRYRTEAERSTAELMTRLESAVNERTKPPERGEVDPEMRQSLFRRLIFDSLAGE
jgi:hypothetical protein